MKNEIVKIDPKEFGLQKKEAETIEQAFMPKITERDGLKSIYEGLLTKEINPELCLESKKLRLQLVKVRTGIAEIHKTQKAFFLAAGRYVDAWKNKETLPVTQMEENLLSIEQHYEKIEAEKAAKLQEKRFLELSKYQDQNAFTPGNLGELTEEVWNNYLLGVRTACEQRIKVEQESKEAEEAELNKGDSEKVKDLVIDLEALKTKYIFKSKKNKKMYSDTCLLIDKVINHIEKF